MITLLLIALNQASHKRQNMFIVFRRYQDIVVPYSVTIHGSHNPASQVCCLWLNSHHCYLNLVWFAWSTEWLCRLIKPRFRLDQLRIRNVGIRAGPGHLT